MHLVGLYTYCKMMHGAYNVKFHSIILKSRLQVRSPFQSEFCTAVYISLYLFVETTVPSVL